MSSSYKAPSQGAGVADDDDEWESMPVENARAVSASIPVSAYSNPHDLPYGDEEDDDSDLDDPRRFRSLPSRANHMDRTASGTMHKRNKARSQYMSDNTDSASLSTGLRSHKATTNATGKNLDIDDARGYNWRSKPATKDNADDEDDSDQEKGYTQLRLDEDEEAEELHAKTEYLFADGGRHDPYGENPAATPLNQMKTTKQLLSEGQKIAYVGLCSLIASEMVRQVCRVPGKNLDGAKQSIEEWKVKVMARLYQHMDIESPEQKMIESLGEHGVLATDLAPSLITTQTIDNPDFDPEALREREEEELELQKEREAEAARQAEMESHKATEPATDSSTHNVASDAGPSSSTTPTRHPTSDIETSEAQPAEEEDEDTDGDLGGGVRKLGKAPTDESKEAASVVCKNASKQANDHDGDIGMLQDETSDKAAATTEKSRPTSVSSDTTAPVVADPNTASQLANAVDAVGGTATIQDAEVGPGSVTTTLGLTKEPQAVQPPPGALDGVTTSISSADATITLDLRWTVLCDLFLVLTADSVYDARSRVLLERVAADLGLTWMDVMQFEKRITDALEIEEGVESLSDESAVKQRMLMARKKRMVMMGLATVGGGLVIGLSAGLLAPVIGAGMGAALGAVGISGTSGFLGGVGGAALITSTGTLGGMSMAGRGMSRRTRSVKTFEFRPVHNNKRVNAIVAVPGFMSGAQDDVRLPFSVIDSVMGDLFSVLWEPDMMQEMGNSLGLLWNETIVQGVQQALALTVAGAGAMFTALAWPLWLTKLGYLIDNPWSNALDRAQAAGLILADTLAKRQLGVRPITLVGFSLGARVIFYALVELSRIKAYGIVQNVYIMGAPITAKDETWKEVRSVVSGRFVSAFSRSDWILGYLHRAASGGLRSIAGLHPIERVQDIENVDVTHVVPGHLAYRALMPLVLSELGFRTTADYFDEPEDLNAIPERQVVLEEKPIEKELKPVATKTGGFGKIFRRKTKNDTSSPNSVPSTPTAGTPRLSSATFGRAEYDEYEDDDLPPRVEQEVGPSDETAEVSEAKQAQDDILKQSVARVKAVRASHEREGGAATPEVDRPRATSAHFDTEAILRELRESGIEVKELESSLPPLPLATNAKKAAEAPKASPETLASQKSNQATLSTSTIANEHNGFGAPAFATQDIPLPPELQNGGVSLTFASYDDDEDDVPASGHRTDGASAHAAAGSDDADVQKYGLSSSAAKDLAERFKSGGVGSPALAGSVSADAPWTTQDEGWGLARPDTSYDVSMGTKSALHSLPTSSGFGYGEMRSPNSSMDQSFEGLTPLSSAVGRGFDFSSTTGTGALSSHSERDFDLSAGVKTSTPVSERTPRRLGAGNLSSEPDPWAENPW